jgi:hypothetical protein
MNQIIVNYLLNEDDIPKEKLLLEAIRIFPEDDIIISILDFICNQNIELKELYIDLVWFSKHELKNYPNKKLKKIYQIISNDSNVEKFVFNILAKSKYIELSMLIDSLDTMEYSYNEDYLIDLLKKYKYIHPFICVKILEKLRLNFKTEIIDNYELSIAYDDQFYFELVSYMFIKYSGIDIGLKLHMLEHLLEVQKTNYFVDSIKQLISANEKFMNEIYDEVNNSEPELSSIKIQTNSKIDNIIEEY